MSAGLVPILCVTGVLRSVRGYSPLGERAHPALGNTFVLMFGVHNAFTSEKGFRGRRLTSEYHLASKLAERF